MRIANWKYQFKLFRDPAEWNALRPQFGTRPTICGPLV